MKNQFPFFVLFLVACSSHKPPESAQFSEAKIATIEIESTPMKMGDLIPVDFSKPSNVKVTLSSISSNSVRTKPVAEKLDENGIQKVLKRLSPIKAQAADQKPFVAKKVPVPKANNVLKEEFPPNINAEVLVETAEKSTEALKVLNVRPLGLIESFKPQISVTFNQAMVPVTSQDYLKKLDPPVSLSPSIEGDWRWVGTKTVVFEPDKPTLPNATKYTLTIQKGTKSISGKQLEDTKVFSFETPRPSITFVWPEKADVSTPWTAKKYGLKQQIEIYFNQEIDLEKIAPFIHMTARNKKGLLTNLAFSLVDGDEKKNHKTKFRREHKNSVMILRPKDQLPLDSVIEVRVDKEVLVKKEKSNTDYRSSFFTYGPLMAKPDTCQKSCRSNAGLGFLFSNQIDQKKYKKSWFKFTPSLRTCFC